MIETLHTKLDGKYSDSYLTEYKPPQKRICRQHLATLAIFILRPASFEFPDEAIL